MPYFTDGDEVVATKFSEVLYNLRTGFDLAPAITTFIENVRANVPIDGIRYATVFLLPYSTVIGLPNGYLASRGDEASRSVVSAGIFNCTVGVAAGDRTSPIGGAYILAGHFSSQESDVFPAFETSLAYVNDILTAHKITRHDHQVTALTPQTLPSRLDFYQVDLADGDLGDSQSISLNEHDLMDVWAKRLPENPAALREFAALCEGLVLKPEVRYLLNLMADCISSFCLGHYERTILDSDRFAELSLRLCFSRNEKLQSYDVRTLKRLYHPDEDEDTILSLLISALELPKTDLVRQWNGRARKARNRIAHDLDFSVATGENAWAALKYNMNLVEYIAGAQSDTDWDLKLLTKGASLMYGLFDAEPKPRVKSR